MLRDVQLLTSHSDRSKSEKRAVAHLRVRSAREIGGGNFVVLLLVSASVADLMRLVRCSEEVEVDFDGDFRLLVVFAEEEGVDEEDDEGSSRFFFLRFLEDLLINNMYIRFSRACAYVCVSFARV